MKVSMENRMTKLETNVDFIKEELSEVKTSLNKFIDSADSKYASKLVEKIVYGLCGFILLSVLTALLTKILGVW